MTMTTAHQQQWWCPFPLTKVTLAHRLLLHLLLPMTMMMMMAVVAAVRQHCCLSTPFGHPQFLVVLLLLLLLLLLLRRPLTAPLPTRSHPPRLYLHRLFPLLPSLPLLPSSSFQSQQRWPKKKKMMTKVALLHSQ